MTYQQHGHRPGARSLAASQLARDRLGAVAIVCTMMAAAAPFVVVAGLIPQTYGVSGITSVPAAFVVTAGVLALFSVGYVAMSRHIVNAGAMYAFVARGLGRHAGVAAALIALVAYNALQLGLYGLFAVAAGDILTSQLGLCVPWWVATGALWLVVAVLGVMRIDISGKILAALMFAEVAIILLFDAVFLTHPAPAGLTFETLDPAGLLTLGTLPVLLTGVLGFVGFEQATIYAEEAKDRERTVPRATYASIVVIGLLYAGSAWAISVGAGADRVAARSAAEDNQLIFNLAAPHLGGTIVTIGAWLMVTSVIAASLSFHNAVARYAYALGREGVLPRAFGATSRHFSSPKIASLAQSVLAAGFIAAYALAGLDPLVHGFFWGGMLGGLGCLVLYTLTAAAIPAYFTRHACTRSPLVKYAAPTLALAALAAITIVAVRDFHVMIGVPAGSAAAIGLPATYLAAALIGVAWTTYLKAAKPRIFHTIGLGAHAATGQTTTTPTPAQEGVTA